ncbi:unnamed protein product [Amoebophrya sp. A25]|nr:unnamed protein product [Amoebophrya sp. A25]|eukprot:GSA25T00005978001.1
MLAGKHPFYEPGRDDYKGCRSKIMYTDPDWRRLQLAGGAEVSGLVPLDEGDNNLTRMKTIRRDGKHLCSRLLEKEPQKRLSARQAMAYPFVRLYLADSTSSFSAGTSGEDMLQILQEQAFRALFLFARLDRLSQATLRLVAKELDEPHISPEFRALFSRMDGDGDGLINRTELIEQAAAWDPKDVKLLAAALATSSAASSAANGDRGGATARAESHLSYRDLLAALWLMPLVVAERPDGDNENGIKLAAGCNVVTPKDTVGTGSALLADIFPRFALGQDSGITRASLRYTLAPSQCHAKTRATGLNGFERVTSEELDAIFAFYASTSSADHPDERRRSHASPESISYEQYRAGFRKLQRQYAAESARMSLTSTIGGV